MYGGHIEQFDMRIFFNCEEEAMVTHVKALIAICIWWNKSLQQLIFFQMKLVRPYFENLSFIFLSVVEKGTINEKQFYIESSSICSS